jgi:hypothetical protein
MFNAVKIVCEKKTHQPRVQAQKELDFKLTPTPLITRFLGYSECSGGGSGNKNQTQSYLTNQCVGIMSSLGGSPFGHKCPEAHSPAYHTVVITDLQEGLFLHAGMPGVLVMLARIQEEYDACDSKKELVAKRLFMAQGASRFLYEAVVRALLVAASRPLSITTGRLDREAPAIYERFSGRQQLPVYGNPVFSCDEFKVLVERVKRAQEQEDDNIIEVSSQQENAITLAVKNNVGDPLSQLTAQVSNLTVKIEAMSIKLDKACQDKLDLERQNCALRSFIASQGLAMPDSVPQLPNYAVVSPCRSNRPNTMLLPQDSGPDDMDIHTESEVTLSSLLYRAQPADDTTSTGMVRKRRRGYTQDEQERFSLQLNMVPTHSFTPSVNLHTLSDWWNEYAYGSPGRQPLRDLETERGAEWRKDLPGQKAKTTTWSLRKNVYALVECYMTISFCVLSSDATVPFTAADFEVRPLTEEEALAEANKTYVCCLSSKGTPNVREKLVPQFKVQKLYEMSSTGPRRAAPLEESTRFVPDVVRNLVMLYTTNENYWFVSSGPLNRRSLTLEEAWREAGKTTAYCLKKKQSLELEFTLQENYEIANSGRCIDPAPSGPRFFPLNWSSFPPPN